MKKVIVVAIFSTLFFACVAHESINLHVVAKTAQNAPVTHAKVIVQNKIVGLTDERGIWDGVIATQSQESLWATLIDPDFTSAQLAVPIQFSVVKPFYDNNISLSFTLQSPAVSSRAESAQESSDAMTSQLQPEVVPSPKTIVTEENLPPSEIPETTTVQGSLEKTKTDNPVVSKQTEAENKNDVETSTKNKSKLFVDKLKFIIRSQKSPLADAQIYMGRKDIKTLIYLGKTNTEGQLLVDLPKELQGETIHLHHACCLPLTRQLAAGSGAQDIIVDLQPGVGHDFFAMAHSYGLARGIENVQLKTDDKTKIQVDNSSVLGLISATGKILRDKYILSAANTFEESQQVSAKLSTTSDSPTVVYFSPKEVSKPVIAMLEVFAGPSSRDSSLWKRFKRDFQARFLTTSLFRPLLTAETENILEKVSLTPNEIKEKGWEFTPLKEHFDFSLVFDVRETTDSYPLNLSLIGRDKHVFATWKISQDQLAHPEKISSQQFTKFLEVIPFEGRIESVNADLLTLNFGSRLGRQLKLGQIFTLLSQSSPFSPQLRELGNAKVTEISSEKTILKLDIGSAVKNIPVGALAIRAASINPPETELSQKSNKTR